MGGDKFCMCKWGVTHVVWGGGDKLVKGGHTFLYLSGGMGGYKFLFSIFRAFTATLAPPAQRLFCSPPSNWPESVEKTSKFDNFHFLLFLAFFSFTVPVNTPHTCLHIPVAIATSHAHAYTNTHIHVHTCMHAYYTYGLRYLQPWVIHFEGLTLWLPLLLRLHALCDLSHSHRNTHTCKHMHAHTVLHTCINFPIVGPEPAHPFTTGLYNGACVHPIHLTHGSDDKMASKMTTSTKIELAFSICYSLLIIMCYM